MFREPIDHRGGLTPEHTTERIAETVARFDNEEAAHATMLERIRQNPALATLVRGALGLSTALAVGLLEREANAVPQPSRPVKLSFTTFDPRTEVKQATFDREARTAHTRALSKQLETRHDRGLRLITASDTAHPSPESTTDLATLLNGRAVYFDELTSSFKGWDSRKAQDNNSATDPMSSEARIQKKLYAIDRTTTPEPLTETVMAQSYEAPTRNDAVHAALQQTAYLTQRGIGFNLLGESQYIRAPYALQQNQKRPRTVIISTQAYHVAHVHTSLALTDLHVAIKEKRGAGGEKTFVASVTARGALLRHESRQIAEK